MGRSIIEKDSQGRKRCSRCKEYKPLREFYNSQHTRDGKAGYCVDCNKEAAKQWKQKHSSGNKAGRPKIVKPTKEISTEEKRLKQLEYGWIPPGAITRRCNRCKRLRVQEVIKEGTCAVCSRKVIKSNKPGRPRKYKYRNELGRRRAFAKTDVYRSNVKASKHRRRSREKSSGSFIAKEWLGLKTKYNNTCLCCGKQEPEIQLTVDHIKPLAVGGLNTIDNIQPLCMECNTKKGIKEIDYRS